MHDSHDSRSKVNSYAKVFYTPVEAAIRWSGFVDHEKIIIRALRGRHRPQSHELSRWPQLHLNVERIYDGMVNGDLPFGSQGITSNDPDLLATSDVTVRHVDLRAWMLSHYPDQRPDFLFDAIERTLHPAIGIDIVQQLILERELLRASSTSSHSTLQALQSAHEALQREHARVLTTLQHQEITPRAEATYLNIIGAMLQLMLDHAPSGKPYSSFRSQDAIITALVTQHGALMGIAERTLQLKFAQANRQIAAQTI